MAFPRPHLLFRQLGKFGTIGALVEQWTVGLRLDLGAAPDFDENKKTAFLQTVQAASSDFHSAASNGAGLGCFLTELTAAYIGTDGKYLGGSGQPTTRYIYGSPVGGAGTIGASWDTARVYSLRTAIDRGRAHAGRIYYPNVTPVGTDGRWSTTQASSAALEAKAWLDAINAACRSIWPTAAGIAIFSFVGGIQYPVIRVQVGQAPDTQRRRTKSLVENWQGSNLAGALAQIEQVQVQVYPAH